MLSTEKDPRMKIRYDLAPDENSIFHILVHEVTGDKAKLKAYLNGEQIDEKECDDPPCYEQFGVRIPPNTAGQTLVLSIRDSSEEHELAFFIKDDGTISFDSEKVSNLAPTTYART